MTFLKYRTAWIIPLVIAVVVAFMGLWSRSRVGAELRRELADEIETVLQANSTALEIWLDNQKRLATSLALDGEIRPLMVGILASGVEKAPEGQNRNPDYRPVLTPAHREFSRIVGGRIFELKYPAAMLIDPEGVIVAESEPTGRRIGRTVFDDHHDQYADVLKTGKPVIITPFKISDLIEKERESHPEHFKMDPAGIPPDFIGNPPGSRPQPGIRERQNGPGMSPPPGKNAPRGMPEDMREMIEKSLMQVAVPVRDLVGNIVGVLSLVIDSGDEFSRILSVARPGDSGETYAFDASGLMLSRSRFDDQLKEIGLIDNRTDATSALTLVLRDPGKRIRSADDRPARSEELPYTYLVDQAIKSKGSSVNISGFRDYRGVRVVGGYKWLSQFGFGIAVKLDETEASRPLNVLSLVFIALFLVMILFAMGLVGFSYFHISLNRKFNLAQMKARQLGQYTLQEKIGQGGMGVVYRACHALLRRETAIKLLSPEVADGATLSRFEKEVKLTCRLTHPNTIQVYDYGHTPDGIFYYAMEYLPGMNLAEMIARCGPQPESHVIYILSALCESLYEAHSLGLIHRDIKPANILLCERGGLPEIVKVLDFGLAKEYREGKNLSFNSGSKSRNLTGTPNFMSPESIVDAEQVNHLSDIYAVGAVGLYLLTGEHLFPEAGSISEVCRCQMEEWPLNASQRLGREVCPAVESILMQCLAKDPSLRPQSTIDVFNALQSSPLAGEWNMQRRFEWWNRTHDPDEQFEIVASESSFTRELNIDLTQR